MTQRSPPPGRFITVEGTEGAGKTTCLEVIRERLEAAGKPVLVTREPGGTDLGEAIRGLLLSHRAGGMSVEAELLLMFAARAEHITRVLRPALEDGRWVLCDRFTDATFAYQGGGRGMAAQRIRSIRDWVQGGFGPDLTLVLDLDPALGLERAGRRSAPDRFEAETLAFFHRVREAYRSIARSEPDRVRLVDASAPLAEVQARIVDLVDGFVESA